MNCSPRNFAYFLFLLLVTSCGSGRYADPRDLPISVLEETLEDCAASGPIEISDDLPDNWWELFGDEQLSCLIQTSLTNNPTLHKAHANLLLAHYAANRARSTLFPQLNWGADVSRQKLSETGLIPFNQNPQQGSAPIVVPGGFNLIPVYFTQYETEFTASYDFDLWGKRRHTLHAALSEVQARLADEIFARLQLSIALAQTYYQLQIALQRRTFAKAVVDNQTQQIALLQQRAQGNLASQIPLRQAEASLATAKTALLQLEGEISVQETALRAYLAADFAETICPIPIAAKQLPKVPLPCDLPLHLLAHRPDITAQLWLLDSASEQIEVARAGFYPDFNLAAVFGFQTLTFAKLFEWPSSFFNVDPAVTLPLFQGGRLVADLRTSELHYDRAIYEYNELVIQAVREVLQAIAILRTNAKQLAEAQQRAQREQQQHTLFQLRQTHGIGSALDVLASEQTLWLARDQEAVALSNQLQAMLSLIKAIGGGYEICYQNDL